ncbi:sulfatase-like hydrolase/transferase [Flavobacteriaceae bacterium S356]|uniref:Sulfatase-like hydrolase/transferase n=1 Tax=Asprobacillus argus TaxID=3076534 RepID=A0ABU3LHB6_9FLAO|nr:sulfatase-like hydrolase/transferase [Flavobacteriaceae bacterium S356]
MEFLTKVLKYLFEIRVEILNLLLLLSLSFVIIKMIRKRNIRLLVAGLLTLFISLQLISLYFVQTFIGYQFYVHFNVRDITGMMSIYTSQIILLLFIFSILLLMLYHSKQLAFSIKKFLLKKFQWSGIFYSKKIHLLFIVLLVSASGYFMTLEKGIIGTSIELMSMLDAKEENIQETLNNLGFKEYTFPNNLKAEKGKNIIVLSLESLEKGYLDGRLSHLTPNLNALKKEWNYYDMTPSKGSEWTSGSLYTSLTGLPAYFGVQGNSIFQKAFHSNITGISHILEKAGYEMTYISSSEAEFSGVQELLHTFQIDNIVDQFSHGKGFRDKDVFEAAKKRIKSYDTQQTPFMLFISTVDTHFPNGIYDDRMEKYISPKENDLQFMVAALDYLVGDFIAYLKRENLLSNTVIYIYPDHLKMGSPISFDDIGARSLYVLTNAKKEDLKNTDSLYQIDIPNIVLDGANIKHNGVFLTDHISGDKNQFIKDHLQGLISLNTSGISRFNAKTHIPLSISKNYDVYKQDTLRYIAHAGGKIDDRTYTNSLEALDLNYKKGFRLFELDIIKTSDNKFVAAHDWDFWAEITNFKGQTPVTQATFLKYPIRGTYTPMSMSRINQWFEEHPDAILVTDKVNDPIAFSKQFVDKNRLMMELFDWQSIENAIKAGIKSPIVAQHVLENISGNKVGKLKKAGVFNVAVSRTFIEKNITLLKELKASNIKVYAYHLNFDSSKDEEYVVKYEMDAIYGIYADTWNFSKE